MTDLERLDLQRLKSRQIDLLGQLTELGRRIDAFENRVTPAQAAPVAKIQPPAIIPPIAQPPVVIEPLRQPVITAPATPIIPPQIETLKKAVVPQPIQPVIQLEQKQSTPIEPPVQPAPDPMATPEPAKRSSFEMRLGTFWLVRIGILMLLTSLVFFGNYAYQNFVPRLGPAGKVGLLYLASGALLGIGAWLQRKQESLKNYAQVLIAGGLAAVYFTTYAAHHFPNLQIIKNAVVDGGLLLGWAAFIIWLADRKKSEVLALFAVLLAYYTSIITHAGLFTLYSNLVLTLAAVFFLVRNRWATLSFASLAATYVSYAFWRFFHAGAWQWADPSDELWTGNYFLIGYWVLFTAAVFLSRHEQFNRRRRASFLSLNNSAFFSAFILTMLQVHQGGFWKFSLAYGAVLLGLAILARRVLAEDRLTSNAYLTQGLLLATLGLLTHFTGFQLALLLGVESVMLLMLGGQLKNRVLDVGSIIAAVLAAAWLLITMEPLDHTGLMVGSSVGAMMLWNAFWLCRKNTFDKSARHPRTLFYTLLGLAIWLVTTWQNLAPEWRGLAIAGESVAFLLAARPLGNRVLKHGAYVFAGLSLCVEATTLGNQFFTLQLLQRVGLTQGGTIGALLLFNALWEKRQASNDKQMFHPPVSFFSTLSLLAWLITTTVFTPRQFLAPALAIEALALTAAFYPLRLKEIPLLGQLFLLFAQMLWLYDTTINHVIRPWWNPISVLAVTLVLASWWQRQKSLVLRRAISLSVQGVYAFAIIGVLYYWLQPQFTAPAWLAFASGLAILLTLYAALNRYWLLAATGQFFLFISGWEFCVLLWDGKPEWYLPLVPIATFIMLSLAAVKWFELRPQANPKIRKDILDVGRCYRVIALVMSLFWIQRYIAPQQHFWVLSALGTILFLVAGWQRSREILAFGAVFTTVGLVKFIFAVEAMETVYWPNFFAILALLMQQQIAKRRPENYSVAHPIHTTVIVAGGLVLWLYVSRWILQRSSGFYLTAGWSGLALVLFTLGMVLRERIYRWLGLGVLACALGRVVIFDVWKLETIYRIFSFMALGIVLLVLGFVYNKYQDKIKQWL